MKRAVIDHYGPPGMIRIEDIESFPLKGNRFVIENHASSVNPVDYKVRKGNLKLLSGLRFPKQLGGDFSGVVIHSVDKDYPLGSEVFGFVSPLQGGAYAEEIIAGKRNIAIKPSNLSFSEAGVLSIAALTAFEGIMTKGRVEKGTKVLINGSTGGVGAYATQLALALGAEVTGTCSSKNKEFALSLGAHKVFDYAAMTPEEIGRDFDLVYDTAGKIKWSELKKYGHKGTKFMSCAGSVNLLISSLVAKNLQLIIIKPDNKKLSYLGEIIEKFNIHPHISEEYKLEDLNEAHAVLELGGIQGKVCINIR